MKTIFVVDDNDTNLFTAQNALGSDYNVLTMPSAVTMFDILEDLIPALILIDINMPDMNGFDAIEKLKKNDAYKDIPVALLTGQLDDETKARAPQAGVIDLIPKPIVEADLLSKVKSYLGD